MPDPDIQSELNKLTEALEEMRAETGRRVIILLTGGHRPKQTPTPEIKVEDFKNS